MARKECAETEAGLQLLAQGVPLREAARRVGVADSTLVRARQRAGMAPGKPGRPRKVAELA